MSSSSTLTRRSFLRTGAVATAAAFAGRAWAPPGAKAAGGHLRRSSYAGRIGQGFAVGSPELRLLSVSDLAGAAVDKSLAGSEDAFALTFAGPLDPALEASAHAFRHGALGTFELFVAPVEQPRGDRRYEAVVDRSVGAPKSPARRAQQQAPATAAAPAAAFAAAPRSARLLRRVALRRTRRGARAEIVLWPGVDMTRLHGRLLRRGKTVGIAASDVRGRRAVLRFRSGRALPAGSYTLLITVVDAAGLPATRRKRIKLG